MDSDGGTIGSKLGAEAVDVAEVEVGGPHDCVYMVLEGKGAVEDDIWTLEGREGLRSCQWLG